MKNMIKFLLAVVLIVACGCQKEEIVTQNSDQIVIVTPDAGVHSFGVNTTGAWSVSIDEESQTWCQFEGPTSGNGIGAFTVRYDENNFDGIRRGLRRQAIIKVITGDAYTSVTIYFRQNGITPKVEFTEKNYTFPYNTTELLLPINTNLSVFEAEDMHYTVKGDWITSHYMTANGAEINLSADANGGEEARIAEVEVSYTDAWGDTFRSTTTVVQQSKPVAPEQFETLKPEEDDDEF